MEELNPLKNPEEYQDKVLLMMKNYELLMGELYAIYADKFPEYAEFWHKISKDEESHAYWIETLTNQIGNEKVYFNEDRFNIAPLNQCIDEVGIKIAEVNNGPVTMLEAIAAATVIENGMIEKNFFQVFESDSPEIKKTFGMLKAATMEHGNIVKDMWAEERVRNEKNKPSIWQKIKNLFS